jgi:hypothetical protein
LFFLANGGSEEEWAEQDKAKTLREEIKELEMKNKLLEDHISKMKISQRKWLTVSSLGHGNISEFFQHRMEKVLEKYLWKFVLVYIDDIIIFSLTLEDHLKHLDGNPDFTRKLRSNAVAVQITLRLSQHKGLRPPRLSTGNQHNERESRSHQKIEVSQNTPRSEDKSRIFRILP